MTIRLLPAPPELSLSLASGDGLTSAVVGVATKVTPARAHCARSLAPTGLKSSMRPSSRVRR